jgi:DMSO reductase anchor subunit
MQPAYSIIFFTTASGAGYGLLAWLGLLLAFGMLPAGAAVVGWTLACGLVLVTAGLMSSAAHLGRPERGWRALTQWRSSWLSREGVLALLAYLPCGALVLLRIAASTSAWIAPLAASVVVIALATVWCTGMIYQSLPTIRAWHQPLVAPIYVALALASGGVLLRTLLQAFGAASDDSAGPAATFAVGAVLLLALLLKRAYWRGLDSADRSYTVGAATGLGRFGAVRPLDPPHTQANFVMREMGYRVARRHALKLRRIGTLLAFVMPAALTFVSVLLAPWPALACALLALLCAAAGLVVERWLFFAEAQHVVTLYYGAQRA